VVTTHEIPIFHKVWSMTIGYGEFESDVRFSKFWCWYSPAGVVPAHEIPIFHKVWSKVIGYGEFESDVRTSKFCCWYSPAGVVPTHEIPIFHKVWSKVIEYGESESDVSFRWKSCFTAACKIYYLVFSLEFFENSWRPCLVFTADILSG